LIETDSPFLAPVPHRGKRNEPAFVVKVAEKIAELRGIPVDQVGRQTSENFRRFFSLLPRNDSGSTTT
jgi:TatD DNase family protein